MSYFLLLGELLLVLLKLEGHVAKFGLSSLIFFIQSVNDSRELGDLFLKLDLLGSREVTLARGEVCLDFCQILVLLDFRLHHGDLGLELLHLALLVLG